MLELKQKLIVALDVDNLEKAKRFVDILYPKVNIFKVGSQLFTACGPEAVKMVIETGAKVFLDLKFHDIPNTVYAATTSASSLMLQTVPNNSNGQMIQPGVFMLTVHTKGGKEMLEAAVKGAQDKAKESKIKRPYLVGVTRLTSDDATGDILGQVLTAARLARDAGLDGVVCSVHEAAAVKKECGKDFIVVTPGIRPKNSPAGDQKRTATVSEAIAAGADFIVVGRPILEAKDPLKTVEELI